MEKVELLRVLLRDEPSYTASEGFLAETSIPFELVIKHGNFSYRREEESIKRE